MGGGRTFDDPNLILPGWELDLPPTGGDDAPTNETVAEPTAQVPPPDPEPVDRTASAPGADDVRRRRPTGGYNRPGTVRMGRAGRRAPHTAIDRPGRSRRRRCRRRHPGGRTSAACAVADSPRARRAARGRCPHARGRPPSARPAFRTPPRPGSHPTARGCGDRTSDAHHRPWRTKCPDRCRRPRRRPPSRRERSPGRIGADREGRPTDPPAHRRCAARSSMDRRGRDLDPARVSTDRALER